MSKLRTPVMIRSSSQLYCDHRGGGLPFASSGKKTLGDPQPSLNCCGLMRYVGVMAGSGVPVGTVELAAMYPRPVGWLASAFTWTAGSTQTLESVSRQVGKPYQVWNPPGDPLWGSGKLSPRSIGLWLRFCK